jgi:hypothetical protein
MMEVGQLNGQLHVNHERFSTYSDGTIHARWMHVFVVVAPIFYCSPGSFTPDQWSPSRIVTGFPRLKMIIDLEFFQFPDVFSLCDLHDLNDFVYCQLVENNPMIAAADRNSLKQS